MTRLDGEKKSPLPWIIGLIVLALLAAAIYYFAVAKGTDAVVANENGVELIDNQAGGLGVDNTTDANMTDANMTDTNMADANMTDTNMADANAMDANSAMMDNSAMGGTDTNMADTNAMDTNAMDSNSAMMDNSAMNAPAVPPASTP